MMARPTKVLTETQKAEVETLAAVLNAAQMADYFAIGRTTFFAMMERDGEIAERYKRGKARAIGAIAQGLIAKARGGMGQSGRRYENASMRGIVGCASNVRDYGASHYSPQSITSNPRLKAGRMRTAISNAFANNATNPRPLPRQHRAEASRSSRDPSSMRTVVSSGDAAARGGGSKSRGMAMGTGVGPRLPQPRYWQPGIPGAVHPERPDLRSTDR